MRTLRRHAWARNKQGPSPASCSRPRLHRTRQPLYSTSVPGLLFKYSTRCRPAAPGISLQPSLLHQSPLSCRAALLPPAWPSVAPSASCQRYPRCCRASSSLLFRFRNLNLVSCMHARRPSELTHAAQAQQHHGPGAYARSAARSVWHLTRTPAFCTRTDTLAT